MQNLQLVPRTVSNAAAEIRVTSAHLATCGTQTTTRTSTTTSVSRVSASKILVFCILLFVKPTIKLSWIDLSYLFLSIQECLKWGFVLFLTLLDLIWLDIKLNLIGIYLSSFHLILLIKWHDFGILGSVCDFIENITKILNQQMKCIRNLQKVIQNITKQTFLRI